MKKKKKKKKKKQVLSLRCTAGIECTSKGKQSIMYVGTYIGPVCVLCICHPSSYEEEEEEKSPLAEVHGWD
uniref:Uncharacterized protein n=1 Tax=Hordeum vulgare subsp. vulgare TaxID=112509 RepID=A0A8I6Y0T6_HORVV